MPRAWCAVDWPELLRAACAGIKGAAGEVFARLDSYCVMVAGSQLGFDLTAKLGASDIVQKSFMEAFARFTTFGGSTEADMRAWLRTIIDHNVIDAVRHYRGAQRDHPSASNRSTPRWRRALSINEPPSHEFSAASGTTLSPKPWRDFLRTGGDIVELRYRDGLDFAAAAHAAGLTEANARKLCACAIQELRGLLVDAEDHLDESHG